MRSVSRSARFARLPSPKTTIYLYTEIVKALIECTDNPNAPDNNGWTPIHEAAKNGHTEIVKALIECTDNPNAPDIFGWTPIHEAAMKGHIEIVKALIECTDNPNAPDDNGWTPIHVALGKGPFYMFGIVSISNEKAVIGQTEIVKALIKYIVYVYCFLDRS